MFTKLLLGIRIVLKARKDLLNIKILFPKPAILLNAFKIVNLFIPFFILGPQADAD